MQSAGPRGARPVLRSGNLELDFAGRSVRGDGREVQLTPTELDLLEALGGQPDGVLTDHMLLQQVWGGAQAAAAHHLRV
jgi:DNA-binding response OmpR family regulator